MSHTPSSEIHSFPSGGPGLQGPGSPSRAQATRPFCRWRLARRVLLGLLIVLLLIGAFLVQWFRSAARNALPQLDGTIAAQGLHAPVSVVRDPHGVPSIAAQSLDDLFFAQGYVTAQDRLWQMDMMRRFAAGELAAALGPRYVELDRKQRVLGLREMARRSLAAYSPEVRSQLDAYARGVNAYIAAHRFRLPLEMRVLRYFPRGWTAEDSVLVGASMAEMLTHGIFQDELNRERILQKLGPELTADLYPDRSQRDIAPGHDLDEIEPSAKAGAANRDEAKPAQVKAQFKEAAIKRSRSRGARRHATKNGATAERRGKRSARRRTHGKRGRSGGKGWQVCDDNCIERELWRQRAENKVTQPDAQLARESTQQQEQPQQQNQLPHPSPNAGLGWGTLEIAEKRARGTLETVDQRAWDFVQQMRQRPMDQVRAGSNEWAVSGAHTASGRPLLSNDMHLPHHIPNTWYEAHLSCTAAGCGNYDVAGVTLPGVPWVIVGHNRRIAWGFTNVGIDVQDVFVENFNTAGEYQTPAGWRTPELRHETIHVKRGRDVEMDVIVTRHGPIISDEITGENRKLALKWAFFDTGLTIPFYAMNTAQNWQQFREALSGFNGPGQNVVYADVDGNIGYQATGRAPLRASGDGTLPVSGADDAHEWTGYLPFQELPSAYNPPSGIIATANGRIVPEGYKYSLSHEWESPYRTERIYRVLRQNKKFTAGDMLALQNDVQSGLDRFVAQRMVYAVDQTPGASERLRTAAELLRRFDGELSVDSAGAAIEQKARAWLMDTLLASKLGEDANLYHWYMNTVWLENMVAFQPARWLPTKYASWNALLAAAVEAAVNSRGAPRNLAKWQYGDYAAVEIDHALFGKVPWLKKYSSTGRWPQSGNGITVKQVGGIFAPSERFNADLADLKRSTLNIVNGQSGNLFSPYFNDQFEAWYRGTSFELPFAPETVERTAAHKLTMLPEGSS
jgi:acyl-homoserine lactone acylase PvdQ